jgi:hypothetical protein
MGNACVSKQSVKPSVNADGQPFFHAALRMWLRYHVDVFAPIIFLTILAMLRKLLILKERKSRNDAWAMWYRNHTGAMRRRPGHDGGRDVLVESCNRIELR